MTCSRRLCGLVLGLVSLCSGNPAPAAEATEARIASVVSRLAPAVQIAGELQHFELAARMEHYEVPGVSIAVARDGRIDWARGFGVLAAGGDQRVDAETLFQAASISKPVTALATLRLVDRGDLDLDVDVNQYLRSWQVPEGEQSAENPVTLRRLLSHTAGTTVHGFGGYAVGTEVPSVVQILDGLPPANSPPVRVDRSPGEIYRYSGGGTTIEQLVLTEISGHSFAELMRAQVLDPAGMARSDFAQPLDGELSINAARGHRSGEVISGEWRVHPELAAAGLWTTSGDLLRFALVVRDAYYDAEGALVSQALAREMLTPVEIEGGVAGHGLGPGVAGSGAMHRFFHGGSNVGYRAMLVCYVESGDGAAIMTNGDQGTQLFAEILRAVAVEYDWPGDDFRPKVRHPKAVAPRELRRLTGTFRVDDEGPHEGASFRITIADGMLQLRIGLDRARRFRPESEEKFFQIDANAELRFERDDDDVLVAILFERGHEIFRGRRVRR